MSNPFLDITNFVNDVSQVVASTFRDISIFLKNIYLWKLTWFDFTIVVLIFFLMISIIFILPLRIYPIIQENIELFKRFMGGKFKATSLNKKYKKKFY